MKTWITADTHFGHEAIIHYCNRPFDSAAQMTDAMIRRWNEVVGENDVVWHLGDFGFGHKDQMTKWLDLLNGKKKLIKGNHERHANQWYRDVGFSEVYDKPIIAYDFIIFSHLPIEIINEDSVFGNIYGHIHNDERYKTVTSHTACVSVERWNYTPIELDPLLKQMKALGLV